MRAELAFMLIIVAGFGGPGAIATPAAASPASTHKLPQLPASPVARPTTWPRPVAPSSAASVTPVSIGPDGAIQPLLQRVDPNVGDLNPLSTSLRQLDTGLRSPSAFDQVYRVPGRDDLFLRANGAVYAVFPQSTYVKHKQKTLAQIPASTVFYIGAESLQSLTPDEEQAAPRPEGSADGGAVHGPKADAPDLRVESGPRPAHASNPTAGHGPSATRKPPLDRAGTRVMAMDEQALKLADLRRQIRAEEAEPPPSILNRAGYRSARVHELMQRAVAVAAARDAEERSQPESPR